ncbi:MAG: hypothetical protein NTY24_07465, partial [Mycobacterium sp.]|nr:hypothetical protein [Mycobacterium sp.]
MSIASFRDAIWISPWVKAQTEIAVGRGSPIDLRMLPSPSPRQRWSLGPLVAGEYEQVYRAMYHFTLYDNLGEFLATLNMLA